MRSTASLHLCELRATHLESSEWSSLGPGDLAYVPGTAPMCGALSAHITVAVGPLTSSRGGCSKLSQTSSSTVLTTRHVSALFRSVHHCCPVDVFLCWS